uniref:Putative secreted protein n=1 Tax=Panstrongylus lignarius TaxID=156445 RepID=A0A224Y0J9_9HEMI
MLFIYLLFHFGSWTLSSPPFFLCPSPTYPCFALFSKRSLLRKAWRPLLFRFLEFFSFLLECPTYPRPSSLLPG